MPTICIYTKIIDKLFRYKSLLFLLQLDKHYISENYKQQTMM